MNAATGHSAMSAFRPGTTNARTVTARSAADWLRLAAAPTFALMAALTGVLEHGMQDMLRSGMSSALGGMAPMYLLMSVFHLPPWLKFAKWCQGQFLREGVQGDRQSGLKIVPDTISGGRR